MAEAFLDALCRYAEPVHLHYLWRPQTRDAADEMVLETALNGRAQALVSLNIADFDKEHQEHQGQRRFSFPRTAEKKSILF